MAHPRKKFPFRIAAVGVILSAGVGLAGCDAKEPSGDDAVEALQAGNKMTCVSGGDTFSGKGADVGVANLGGNGKQISFGVTLMAERGKEKHIISSGLIALPTIAGVYHFPELTSETYSGADYVIRTLDMDLIRQFDGPSYSYAYSDKQFDDEAKMKMQVFKFIKSASDTPPLPRYHIVGQFIFNAAFLSKDKEVEGACMMDAQKRAIGSLGGASRYPQFSAEICKAEKKHFDCKFDVKFDGLPEV